MDRPIKILFAGEGGQGVQTIAKLIAKSAFKQGLQTIYIPNFGVEQRGGVSMAFVQIWDKTIDAPKFEKADIAVILSDRAYERSTRHLGKETKLIYDPFTVVSSIESIKSTFDNSYEILATETARSQGMDRSVNVLIMGAFCDLAQILDKEIILELMHGQFQKYYDKKPELKELNSRAFKLGERLMPGGESGE